MTDKAKIIVVGTFVGGKPVGFVFDCSEGVPAMAVEADGHTLYGGYTVDELAEMSRHRTERTRICCCIPDQTKLDERCKNLAVYEIWYGSNPTPCDYSDTCAEHLEELLDDHNRFEIFRI